MVRPRVDRPAGDRQPRCSRDPVAGNIDSVCYTNYDCDAISQWEPIKRYIEDNIGWDKMTCDFFEREGGINGKTIYEAAMQEANWDYPPGQSRTRQCNSCLCTGVAKPQILHKAFTAESTTKEVKWEPGGEHMPH